MSAMLARIAFVAIVAYGIATLWTTALGAMPTL